MGYYFHYGVLITGVQQLYPYNKTTAMKQTACLAFLICCLFSCSNQPKKSIPFLNTGNLSSSFITLNPGQAYDLKTPKGARLRIPAGVFKAAGGQVRLEIKEAYSTTDMLLAGLSTTSNGRLLKSGGMIYLDATVCYGDNHVAVPRLNSPRFDQADVGAGSPSCLASIIVMPLGSEQRIIGRTG